MKVALITPWENAWVPLYKEAIERRGHEFTRLKKPEPGNFDVVLHGWANHDMPMFTGNRNIMFLRRYELFEPTLSRIDWSRINALICVNSWIRNVMQVSFGQGKIKTPVHLVYNAADLGRWTFRKRKSNKKIGMACHVHPKKNLPLALQILGALPDDYELHIAGQIQDPWTAEYLNNLGQSMKRRLFLYDHIPYDQMDLWWEQMGVCLSTSLSEGNPNNVIEAMAKGIKPVVHYWPGAEGQFPEHLFSTVDEAVKMIRSEEYRSEDYRKEVQEKFSLSNIERVLDIALKDPEIMWHPV